VTSDLIIAGVDAEKVERYLKSLFGKDIVIVGLSRLGEPPDQAHGKSYTYGTPIRVDYRTRNGGHRRCVLHTISPGPFGHEHMADRAHTLIWSHQAFNHLPRHVRSLDVGGFQADGNVVSLGNVEEFGLLTEYAEGDNYAVDLERLRESRTLTDLDLARADALCDYLIEIHAVLGHESGLYTRRIRELVGDGECIMGLADSYPQHPTFTPQILQEIEHRCVSWRWRLKNRTHRLRQVHGDFHPWNILFKKGIDFCVLDRSRGEFGDPADDVACLSLNYVFFSLQCSERLEGVFERLFLRFWERYLEKTQDTEILQVVAPFFAFRGLVMASPAWYPNLDDGIRRKLLAFILSVLEGETFDPTQVNAYCGN
jgi:thiamine kinase-like enzyme